MRGPRPKRDATPRSAPKDGAPLSVSQLASRLEDAVKRAFPERIRVSAEISSVTLRTHHYFTIKDEHASINAVLFASAARKVRHLPEHGDQVVITGRLDYYAPSGRISLVVDSIEPTGRGELERRLRELVDELSAKGWLDPASKLALPVFPERVAVLTSKTGAALQDIIATGGRRCPAVGLAPLDVRVQGERAAPEITRALDWISAHHNALGIDAIILTRGGGSLEDLWAFNEYEVARAIRECPIPIVAAIGHETDTTVAELVADARASTPTQAAMMLIPDREALREQLGAIAHRLDREIRRALDALDQRLERLATSGPLAKPARLVAPSADRLDPLVDRLEAATRARLDRAWRRIDHAALRISRHQPAAVHARRAEHLEGLAWRLRAGIRGTHRRRAAALDALGRELGAISPLGVLERGYSVTTAAGGVVRDPLALGPGDEIRSRVAHGTIRSTVISDRATPPTKMPDPRPAGDETRDQMDLF